QEWKSFCNYFGESARILAWYEKRRDANGALLEDQQDFVADLIRDQVFDALIQAKRPADAVRLLADAHARPQRFGKGYESMARTAEQMGKDAGKDLIEHFQGKLVDDLGKLYGALLLAERRDDATAVAELLLKTLDTPKSRLALVRRGLELAG